MTIPKANYIQCLTSNSKMNMPDCMWRTSKTYKTHIRPMAPQ